MRAMWIMAAGLFDPLSEPLSISTLWHLGSPLMVTFYFLILQIPFYMGLAMYVISTCPALLCCAVLCHSHSRSFHV